MNLFNLLCTTPAAAIPTFTVGDCLEHFGQIQYLIFQRKFSSGTTLNTMTVGDALLLATWTALTGASDGTKAQKSPRVMSALIEPGEKREAGGGNDSYDGIPTILGPDRSVFTGVFQNVQQKVISSMDGIEDEGAMTVYLVNEHGEYGGVTDDIASPATFHGIPIEQLFIGDKRFGGRDDNDGNPVEFSMSPNWSKVFHRIKPTDHNPRTAF